MGGLKKHLNPNPVKQIKNTIQDTKDSIKKPMAAIGGKKATPSTSSTLNKPVTVPRTNPKLAMKTPLNSRNNAYTTGQGNAPAPRAYNPTTTTPVVPPITPTLRKSGTRSTMSTLGAGKNRIK